MSELSHTCSALGSLAADNDAKERRQKLSEFAVVQIPTAQREDRYPMIWRAWLRLTAGALLLLIGISVAPGDTDAIAALTGPEPNRSDLFAQHPDGPRAGDEAHFEEASHSRWLQWLQSLDLNDEQWGRIRAIYQQSTEDTRRLRQQLRAEREQLYSRLTSDVDTDQILPIHQRIQSLRQDLENRRFEAMLAMREVLTLEQRLQVAEALQQYRGRRGDHRNQ